MLTLLVSVCSGCLTPSSCYPVASPIACCSFHPVSPLPPPLVYRHPGVPSRFPWVWPVAPSFVQLQPVASFLFFVFLLWLLLSFSSLSLFQLAILLSTLVSSLVVISIPTLSHLWLHDGGRFRCLFNIFGGSLCYFLLLSCVVTLSSISFLPAGLLFVACFVSGLHSASLACFRSCVSSFS